MHLMYNIDFLLAGLVFLLLILGHFLFQRQLDLGYTRSFLLFLVTGIANILMDLLCTVLISLDRPALAELTEGCLTLLYLLQVLVPYTMFYHVVVLLGEPAPRFARRAWCMAGPPALMGLLILLNHWTGYLFQLDGDGSYSRGVLYPVMYLFAGAYILVILALIIRYRARLGRQKVVALGEVLFFGSICTIIQAIHHDFLVAGFGIALGISVLFFTLNNPYFYIDGLTGVYDIRYFHRRADSLFRHQTKFHLLAVDLRQLRQVNLAHGVDQGNRLLEQVAGSLWAPTGRTWCSGCPASGSWSSSPAQPPTRPCGSACAGSFPRLWCSRGRPSPPPPPWWASWRPTCWGTGIPCWPTWDT